MSFKVKTNFSLFFTQIFLIKSYFSLSNSISRQRSVSTIKEAQSTTVATPIHITGTPSTSFETSFL